MKGQGTLFAVDQTPEGFIFEPDFLTPEEEKAFIDAIQSLSFGEFRMHGVVAKRRIAQFGFRYSAGSSQLAPAASVPPVLEPIRLRAASFAGVKPEDLSEILVTEYPPGAGIGWHRDLPQFGIIAGISLGAECRMRFRPLAGTDRRSLAVDLPPRSIYLLTGSARNEWQHHIPPVKELRYSITLRTLRKPRSES